jgi:hypothetical protein
MVYTAKKISKIIREKNESRRDSILFNKNTLYYLLKYKLSNNFKLIVHNFKLKFKIIR